MLVVSGVAPDLDYLSYFAGAGAFLQLHRSALHSVAGGAVAACVLAGAFCALDRKILVKVDAHKPFTPLTFPAAAAVCAVGILGHILLDLTSGVGAQLLWPFYARWFGWPLTTELDLWILLLLAAGLLLPLLFKLVNEEVGERKKDGSGRRGAAITLALLVAYLCTRANFRAQAVDLLLSREYHGAVPLSAGAFPVSSTPFTWRGVAVTDNTIEEAEVAEGPGADFDTSGSVTHYKPGDSPALDTAKETTAARRFLRYAKFPLDSVAKREDGFRVEIRDLRFAAGDTEPDNIVAHVDLDSGARVTEQGLRFASSANP